MKFEIIYLPLVFEDIQEAFLFYKNINSKTSERFLKNVKKEIKRINLNPYLYEIKYKNTRVAIIEKFPYGIHYLIESNTINSNSAIIVVKAILHSSKDNLRK